MLAPHGEFPTALLRFVLCPAGKTTAPVMAPPHKVLEQMSPYKQDRVGHPFFLSLLPGGGLQRDLCAISSKCSGAWTGTPCF